MLNWISQNSQVLNVFTNMGTLLVWLVYAQLLYFGFRRQRHPRLVINRGKRRDLGALCIISNMSKEPVFIEYILAELATSEGAITIDITELGQEYTYEDADGFQQQPTALRDNTRQGPLDSGEFLHIGSFEDVIKRLADQGEIELEESRPKGNLEFLALKIQLICIYGPEDMPFEAERSFEISGPEEYATLTPMSWNTKQSLSIIQRHQLKKKLANLEETNFNSIEKFKANRSH